MAKNHNVETKDLPLLAYFPRFQVGLYDLLLFVAISMGGAYMWFRDTPAHILPQRLHQSGVIVVVMVLAILASAILGFLFNTAKDPKMFLSASGLIAWVGMPLLFQTSYFNQKPFPHPEPTESHSAAMYQAREMFSGRAPRVVDSGGYCYKLYDEVKGLTAVVAFPRNYTSGSRMSLIVYERGIVLEADLGEDTEKRIFDRERLFAKLQKEQAASESL